MSEELEKQVSQLKEENAKLQKQLADNSVGVNGLLAQLDAHKQHVHESTQVILNLRSNVLLLQRQSKELIDKLQAADKKLTELGA